MSDNKQKDWPEWLALAKFAVNNKVHLNLVKFLVITKSLNDELLGDKIWEADLYMNNYECRSISRCG